jgi:Fe-S oxidoreductase
VPGDPRAAWVAARAVSLERALADLGPLPLAARAEHAVLHEHCHTRALGGAGAARAALAAAPGLELRDSGAGCCGMAGAFGLQHPELSRAIAADRLVPALAGADVALAGGISCREQIRAVGGPPALHPAQYLAARLEDGA